MTQGRSEDQQKEVKKMARPLLANIDSDEEEDLPKKKKDATPKKAVAQSPIMQSSRAGAQPSPAVTPRKTPRDL